MADHWPEEDAPVIGQRSFTVTIGTRETFVVPVRDYLKESDLPKVGDTCTIAIEVDA